MAYWASPSSAAVDTWWMAHVCGAEAGPAVVSVLPERVGEVLGSGVEDAERIAMTTAEYFLDDSPLDYLSKGRCSSSAP